MTIIIKDCQTAPTLYATNFLQYMHRHVTGSHYSYKKTLISELQFVDRHMLIVV